MFKTVLATTLVVASLSLTTKPADACSIRGNWCGYPLWAANAFEDPFDRVNPRTGPVRPILSQHGYAYENFDEEPRRVTRQQRPARKRTW